MTAGRHLSQVKSAADCKRLESSSDVGEAVPLDASAAPVTLVSKVAKPPAYAAALISDGDFVLTLRHAAKGLVMPALRIPPKGDAFETAVLAVEQQLGPILGLAQGRFETMFKAALETSTLLVRKGEAFVYLIRVESFTQWYSHYHTAFYFRKEYAHNVNTLTGFSIISLDNFLELSTPSSAEGQAARGLSALLQQERPPPELPFRAPVECDQGSRVSSRLVPTDVATAGAADVDSQGHGEQPPC